MSCPNWPFFPRIEASVNLQPSPKNVLIVCQLLVAEISVDPTEPSKEKKEIAVGNALIAEVLRCRIPLAEKWPPRLLFISVQFPAQVRIKVYTSSRIHLALDALCQVTEGGYPLGARKVAVRQIISFFRDRKADHQAGLKNWTGTRSVLGIEAFPTQDDAFGNCQLVLPNKQ